MQREHWSKTSYRFRRLYPYSSIETHTGNSCVRDRLAPVVTQGPQRADVSAAALTRQSMFGLGCLLNRDRPRTSVVCNSPEHFVDRLTTEHIKSHLQKYRLHYERSKEEFLGHYRKYLRLDRGNVRFCDNNSRHNRCYAHRVLFVLVRRKTAVTWTVHEPASLNVYLTQ